MLQPTGLPSQDGLAGLDGWIWAPSLGFFFWVEITLHKLTILKVNNAVAGIPVFVNIIYEYKVDSRRDEEK